MKKYLVEKLFGIEGLNIAWYGVIIGVSLLLESHWLLIAQNSIT